MFKKYKNLERNFRRKIMMEKKFLIDDKKIKTI